MPGKDDDKPNGLIRGLTIAGSLVGLVSIVTVSAAFSASVEIDGHSDNEHAHPRLKQSIDRVDRNSEERHNVVLLQVEQALGAVRTKQAGFDIRIDTLRANQDEIKDELSGIDTKLDAVLEELRR